ncbi:hypothetical protein [Leptolyngbya ohadii]|uniref:hypothetical protein n=1 Tax=Leptolyngbya ohadii TaxID=1962290 RepID=UPI000B59BBDA|nr:hypothetical protein [Leptolyngbya ohadii]
MPQWFSRAVHRLSGTTFKLILLVAGFLVLWGMLAPVNTIVWWLNQNAESLGLELEDEAETPDVLLQPTTAPSDAAIDCYIVFLPGVGNFSPDEITEGERYFIDTLAARHANCVAVRDVFPYSVRNQDLGRQRFLAPLWQAAKDTESFAYVFVQIRNLWRFAISADDRYGPVYNLGIARTIVDRMNAAHPIVRSDRPINLILLSTSGGTQVALGATAHLREWINNARITVISLGGTFEGRAGFNDVNHLYHLYGDRDWVAQLPRIIFPARWRWTVGSPVNEAREEGRYTVCNTGNQEHSGSEGYFGEAVAVGHTSYLEQTLEQVDRLPIWSVDQPLASECPLQKRSSHATTLK